MKELNSNTCALDGVYLIEASAGTGKTYNIQNLAVRLIVEKNLTIDEILIVTFTRAATAELADRIRGIIQSSFDFLDQICNGTGTPDKDSREYALLQNSLGDFSDSGKIRDAREKLKKALLDFDDNSISTIHGFCGRMLKKNAFESGILFQTEQLDGDQIKDHIKNLIQDEWRKICYAPENREYVGIYRGLVNFDESFKEKLNVPADEYCLHLRPHGSYSSNKYFGEFAMPSLRDFVSLIENPEMEFDAEESVPHSQLAREIMADAKALPVIDPAYQFSKEKSGKIEARELYECPLDYGFGWKKFEELLSSIRPDHWEKQNEGSEFETAVLNLFQKISRFRVSFLNFLRKRITERIAVLKQQENFQTYDDLQKRMQAALLSDDSTLAERLQKQFKAAIIDEFQDTDQTQYDIFTKVFAPMLKKGVRNGIPLFFVGDPKQAIYAFRGGDIFTYKGAAADVGPVNTLSLKKNFRSADKLVEAVNNLFGKHNFPFADPSIQFENVESSGKKTLMFQGSPDDAPETLVDFTVHGEILKGKPDDMPFHFIDAGTNSKEKMDFCAEKVCQLLTSEVYLPSPVSKDESVYEKVQPSDIAILLRSKSDIPLLVEKLQERGIPYVTDTDVNIYDTQEARDLEKLLLALQNPTDIQSVSWFMQTDFSGKRNCRELCEQKKKDADPENAVAETQKLLSALQMIFEQKGFTEMFRNFMDLFQIYERYPAFPQGAQKYSNLIQLRDILTAEESRGSKSPYMVLSWLQKQISPASRTDLGRNTILPTDSSAVKITTIHKSKGLQFPIVFLPDIVGSNINKERAAKYHDPEQENQIYHRLTSDRTELAVAENLQEELRIFYVAVTRAVRANYLSIPRNFSIKSGKSSFDAFCWLYFGQEISADTPMKHLSEKCREILGEIQNDIHVLIPDVESELDIMAAENYSAPSGEGELARLDWSGTTLTPPAAKISYSAAHKYFRRNDRIERSEEETSGDLGTVPPQEKKLDPVFNLPRGDLFGIACHTILEKWDFKSEEQLDFLISRYLSVVRLDDESKTVVKNIFRKTVSAPILSDDGEPFTLQDLAPENRSAEMDFDFKVNQKFSPQNIGTILNGYYKNLLEKDGIEKLKEIRYQEGDETFYTGTADLVFYYKGKYYLADWKTDVLDKTLESFDPKYLFRKMWQKFYLYQSLLYSSALLRFLSLKLHKDPKEVYEQDFGGVRYFFLRGVGPENPGRGIFSYKPDFDLICKVAEVKHADC